MSVLPIQFFHQGTQGTGCPKNDWNIGFLLLLINHVAIHEFTSGCFHESRKLSNQSFLGHAIAREVKSWLFIEHWKLSSRLSTLMKVLAGTPAYKSFHIHWLQDVSILTREIQRLVAWLSKKIGHHLETNKEYIPTWYIKMQCIWELSDWRVVHFDKREYRRQF